MKRKVITAIPVIALLCVFIAPMTAVAQTSSKASKERKVHIYRYKDGEGNLQIGRQIPPENYKYGYTSLDEYGEIIEVVPPEPTPEERAIFMEEMRKKREAEELKMKDDILLKTYGSVKDAVNARDRKLAQIDVVVEVIRGKVVVLRANNDRAIKLAADLERRGQPISEKLLDEMRKIETSINELKKEEAQKKAEKEEVSADFEPVIERMRALEEKNMPEKS